MDILYVSSVECYMGHLGALERIVRVAFGVMLVSYFSHIFMGMAVSGRLEMGREGRFPWAFYRNEPRSIETCFFVIAPTLAI